MISRARGWIQGMEEGKGEKETTVRQRLWILVVLGIVCAGLEVTVHYMFRTAVGYTHIFYILLVLSALWYHRKALFVAVGLVAATIATSLVVGDFSWATVLRAAMFIAVTWVVASISEERDRVKAELQEKKEEVEKKHSALVGYLSEATLRMKGPLEMLRDNLASIRRHLDEGPVTEEEKTMLSVQITHLEQIIENFRELNREIVEEREEIPEAYREFLTR
ncbi:MAG: hypothetical protein QXL43_04825 [Methanolinea sp.]